MVAPGASTLRVEGEIVGPEQYAPLSSRDSTRPIAPRRERSALLAPEVRSLASVAPVRVLFRASQHYATVLSLLSAPRNQRSGSRASLLLEDCWPVRGRY